MQRSYEIIPYSDFHKLVLLEDGVDVGGGHFSFDPTDFDSECDAYSDALECGEEFLGHHNNDDKSDLSCDSLGNSGYVSINTPSTDDVFLRFIFDDTLILASSFSDLLSKIRNCPPSSKIVSRQKTRSITSDKSLTDGAISFGATKDFRSKSLPRLNPIVYAIRQKIAINTITNNAMSDSYV